MVLLVTVRLLASMTILPVVASGAAGSKETVPVTPLAFPEMGSRSESRWNWTLFTPLGSLKSKEVGAAVSALTSPRVRRPVVRIFFMMCVLIFCGRK